MKDKRKNERGAIAIIIAAMLTTLFGFAALAIDAGYLYTRSRSVQAVADAAVRAGMPLIGNAAAAQDAALGIVNANSNGSYTNISANAVLNTSLTVRFEQVQPRFFGKVLGIPAKTLVGRAVGQVIGGAGPALLGLGACGDGWGVRFNGGENMVINGDVQSLGFINYMTSPNTTTNGSVLGDAGCPPNINAHDTVTGSQGVGGPFPNPFAAITFASFPPCDYGDFLAQYDIPFGLWVGPNLPPGVYCSGGMLNVNSVDASMTIIAPGATFLATGPIIIGANNGGTFSPAAGSPQNIILYTTFNGMVSSGPSAIQIGQNFLTFNGSAYAPNGSINIGGGDNTFTGSMVAREVNISPQPSPPFGPTIINGPGGGGGGGAWRMAE